MRSRKVSREKVLQIRGKMGQKIFQLGKIFFQVEQFFFQPGKIFFPIFSSATLQMDNEISN